jgi:NAD-dependent dihydropyrimidine dehydrogenase PreA subunit
MPRFTVVISQGQSANPIKRRLEEDLVAHLLGEPGVEVVVVPHLYDLQASGTGILCLQSMSTDMIVVSWLFPRAAFWTLDRVGVRGTMGATLLKSEQPDDSDEDDDDAPSNEAAQVDRVSDSRPKPNRRIYCLDFRSSDQLQPFLDEIRRIVAEGSVQTFDLLTPLAVASTAAANQAVASPSAATATTEIVAPTPIRVQEDVGRRWYPVIDYSRCTNCMECVDFCLFGVYGVDKVDTILVEQPDNCRKGCPACSRVCPENAIIFPQHKAPAIAGSDHGEAGGLKIDLSKLFGAPDPLQVAVLERDVELVAVGRDAVGMSVGIPKRTTSEPNRPKDDLDRLIDSLDALDL